MALVLEIEHLTGVARAARGPDSGAPDWPPQPDRIFSALVATWAAREQQLQEKAALEWLEAQEPPLVQASSFTERTAPVSFVPPNDRKGGILPARRRRQPRRFPSARPHDPVVRLIWREEPEDPILAALNDLAMDTAYVGHSASLTRCWFRAGQAELTEALPARRRVYRGRMAELIADFDRGVRPSPGAPVKPVPVVESVPHSVFSPDWLILRHDTASFMPDVRAGALVAKAIRDALLSGYTKAGLPIPEWVSGHTPDKTPTRLPHLAFVPLPHVGFPYADGHVTGFALVPPHGKDLLKEQDFLAGLRAVIKPDADGHYLSAYFHGLPDIRLRPVTEPTLMAQNPALYTKPAQTFATVTPIVLDRRPELDGRERVDEIKALIGKSCVNIGLPEPEIVIPDKHSAFEGAASARPSGKAPAWMNWRLPPSLANRPMTHAVLRFPEKVEGPVMLGAGRFVGLGLCRPLPESKT